MLQQTKESGSSQQGQGNSRWSILLATGFLTVHAILVVDTLRQKSATVDEVGHLPAGISYWQKGTFALYHHNPPLVKLIAALPVLAAEPVVDYSKSWEVNLRSAMPLSPWAFGWEYMYANAARYHELFVLGRLPVVLFSLMTGTVVFLWARELFGPLAGVLSVALWSFCPNVIAHAGLITTDLGATSLAFVATYLFWRYLRAPSWTNAIVAGLLLGLAQLTKFSCLILYVLWPLMGTVWLITRRGTNGGVWNEASNQPHAGRITQVSSVPNTGPAKPARTWIRHLFAKSVAIVLVSLVVTNIGYAFEGSFTPLGSFQFLSRALTRPRTGLSPQIAPSHPWSDVLRSRQNRFVGTWLAALPVPLPRHYVEGFDEQKLETEGVGGQGYPVYLRGEVRRTGWWWYYFYALAVKVPLGTWLLTCVALFTALRFSAGRATFFDESTLAAPVVITLLVMSFLTDINLGLRYVLPIFPYWFVLVSRVACLMHGKRLASLVVLAAIGWNMARSVATHPHHLSFFNELAGGPANGYRHLIDSNLDWGQDLLPLQSWLAARGQGEPIGLAYFGNVDPSILAASGRRLNFALAPPRTLDDLRLVATKPDGEVYRLRNQWIAEHASELQAWLQRKHEMGQPAGPNDHPEIRKLALERIGLSGEVAPGVYAISANLIAGLPFRIRDQEGSIWNAEQDAYSHFRSLTPIAQIGFSIFVYDVSPAQAEQLNASLRR